MSGTSKTVKINGVTYDASTGLPVKRPKSATTKLTNSIKAASSKKSTLRGKTIHKKPSRSITLKRSFVRKKASSGSTKTSRPNSINKINVTNAQTKTSLNPPHQSIDTITVATVRHPLVTHLPVSHAHILNIPKEKHRSINTSPERTSNSMMDEFDDLLHTIDEETADTDLSTETDFEIPSLRPRKGLKITVATLIIVPLISIASLLVLLNLRSIQMFIASARTGIPGQIPSYTAAGFTIADVTVTSGLNIEIIYHDNKNQSYTIIKSKTNAPDTALQFDNDQPIATITKNGLLYTVNYGQLSKTQVQKIADNL